MPKNAAPKTEKKSATPTFKSFARAIANGDKPRGCKVFSNADGGFTFTYGPKSAPVAVVASKDAVAALGLASLGLKLS